MKRLGQHAKQWRIHERALSDREIDEVTRQTISERLVLLQPTNKEQE